MVAYVTFLCFGISDIGMKSTASLPLTYIIPCANLPISRDSAGFHTSGLCFNNESMVYFLPVLSKTCRNFCSRCCASKWCEALFLLLLGYIRGSALRRSLILCLDGSFVVVYFFGSGM